MMSVLPFLSWTITPELRKAAEYYKGKKLTEGEVIDVLQKELDGIVERWTSLGKWIIQLDDLNSEIRPKLSGIAVNNPSQERRDSLSISIKKAWAAKRAIGERLPKIKRAPSREFGQRTSWRTPEQRAFQSQVMKEMWAQRKAIKIEKGA
jgi:hypothetical protein